MTILYADWNAKNAELGVHVSAHEMLSPLVIMAHACIDTHLGRRMNPTCKNMRAKERERDGVRAGE